MGSLRSASREEQVMMTKNIAVTGAAGFIGSNLCEELLNRGYLVKGVDNLSMGNLTNLGGCLKSRGFV
jgi:UDP-N-acetylglucosamine/UDP-N-acetylgalactosamine 4-epimerase